MSATLVSGALSAAVLTLLRASSAVTALVPATRIVDEMPAASAAVYPLVLVETQGEAPFNTLGSGFGSEARVGVRVLSQYRGDAETGSIASACRGVLDGAPLTLGGVDGLLTFESLSPIFKTAVGLVTTREQVAEYAVTVHA